MFGRSDKDFRFFAEEEIVGIKGMQTEWFRGIGRRSTPGQQPGRKNSI
jgi:hypothetical protein